MARRTAERPAAALLLGYWLPVALYVGMIFLVSAQPNLKAPLTFPNGDKVMHLLEYAGLGLLLARAVLATASGLPAWPLGLLALCLGMMVGTGDELFQATVPGRQSSAFDLAADTVGLGLAQFLYRALLRS